uniref:Uncharacterized protein n=1 Tax=Knipowitschia caucasica TaxID=637954 RepID=A0AAV2LC13_KNICA
MRNSGAVLSRGGRRGGGGRRTGERLGGGEVRASAASALCATRTLDALRVRTEDSLYFSSACSSKDAKPRDDLDFFFFCCYACVRLEEVGSGLELGRGSSVKARIS